MTASDSGSLTEKPALLLAVDEAPQHVTVAGEGGHRVHAGPPPRAGPGRLTVEAPAVVVGRGQHGGRPGPAEVGEGGAADHVAAAQAGQPLVAQRGVRRVGEQRDRALVLRPHEDVTPQAPPSTRCTARTSAAERPAPPCERGPWRPNRPASASSAR